MNQELFEKSMSITCRIIALRRTIRSCNAAIENIGHGADVTVKGTNKINIMKQCSLDDGQEKLMQDMLITILRNRMEEAEVEYEIGGKTNDFEQAGIHKRHGSRHMAAVQKERNRWIGRRKYLRFEPLFILCDGIPG